MARVELRDVKSKEEFVRMIEGVVKGMLAFWEITTEQFQKNLSFSYFALFNCMYSFYQHWTILFYSQC